MRMMTSGDDIGGESPVRNEFASREIFKLPRGGGTGILIVY